MSGDVSDVMQEAEAEQQEAAWQPWATNSLPWNSMRCYSSDLDNFMCNNVSNDDAGSRSRAAGSSQAS